MCGRITGRAESQNNSSRGSLEVGGLEFSTLEVRITRAICPESCRQVCPKRSRRRDLVLLAGLSKEIATESNPVGMNFFQTHQSCVGTPMY